MRVLVTGWFSFEPMGATAGDVQARDLACSWLAEAGIACDVANAPVFGEGVDWRSAEPAHYSHLLFVCGPFGRREPLPELVARFSGSRLVALDVSLVTPPEEWDPFDALLERDSAAAARPDMAFAAAPEGVPVVGVVLVPKQREYGGRAMHEEAEAMVERLTRSAGVVSVAIDTALTNDPMSHERIRSAGEAESVIARMDAVVTTRLHGLVLALKSGVPAVALDPVAGGAKVLRQAETLGWPYAFAADEVDDADLRTALAACLGEEARRTSRECARRAKLEIEELRGELLHALSL